MTNEITPKNADKYICEFCNFKCSKKSDWSRHVVTLKHQNTKNTNDFTPKNTKKQTKTPKPKNKIKTAKNRPESIFFNEN